MTLTHEQIAEVKKQILEQTKHLPEEKRNEIEQQIDAMSPEELELFVKDQMSKQGPQKGIFRMIVDKDIPAKIIEENKDIVIVTDIKPISKGHLIIIPKKAAANTNGLPDTAFSSAKEISKKIVSELNAKGTEIQTEFKFGEVIINVIPIYDKPLNINSPRYDASDEELLEVYKKLKVLPKPEVIRPALKKSKKVIKLNRKIP